MYSARESLVGRLHVESKQVPRRRSVLCHDTLGRFTLAIVHVHRDVEGESLK